jgi:hypothetical protein
MGASRDDTVDPKGEGMTMPHVTAQVATQMGRRPRRHLAGRARAAVTRAGGRTGVAPADSITDLLVSLDWKAGRLP